MIDDADLLRVAHEAVDLASGIIRTMPMGALTAKGDRDMASEVDVAVERQVRALLRRRTPEIGFLGEEDGPSDEPTDLVWALDPVDGTVNFVHGSPLCAVSLGLMAGTRSVLGVIEMPFLGNRYWAAQGRGAWADGRPISVAATSSPAEALVALGDYAVGDSSVEKNAFRFALVERLVPHVQRIRIHGSSAVELAWVAAGRVDATILLSNQPWDTSAGVVIAREAGAVVVDRDGSAHTRDSTAAIAANASLLPLILDLFPDLPSVPD